MTQSMQWRQFNRWALGGVIVAAAAVPVCNVLIDPYEVFGTGLVRMASTANERVVKSHHLLAQERYEALLVGSSVTGVIDPRLFGRGVYNASVFSATPGDILKMLQLLDRSGRLPERLYVGLDPFMFTAPRQRASQMRLPPAASKESAWTFWRDYLFAGHSAVLGKVVEAAQRQPGVSYDLAAGNYRLARLDEMRAMDPWDYALKKVVDAKIPVTQAWWHEDAGRDLTTLTQWLSERPHVRVVYFICPMRDAMRLALGADGDTFFHTVRAATQDKVLDLSDHDVVNDTLAWYEQKHFTPQAAAAVVLSIKGDEGSGRLAAAAKLQPQTRTTSVAGGSHNTPAD